MRILHIEDNVASLERVERIMRDRGCVVHSTEFGEDGVSIARRLAYDLIILDLTLPDIEGLSVLKELRDRRIHTPVLVLSRLRNQDEGIEALNAGADDYLTKPYRDQELSARVTAIVRRAKGNASSLLRVGILTLDIGNKFLFVHQIKLGLAPQEYKIFELLALHKGSVVTKATIEDHLYDDRAPETNVVQTVITRLRRKIALATKTKRNAYIVTVWGQGFSLREPGQEWQLKSTLAA